MSPAFNQLKPFAQPPSPPPPSSSPTLGQRQLPPVSVPSPSTPGTWQGSAFGSLSKNVAAPSVAPTACLKVRHLFDSRSQRERGWVVQVKEELLRRCAASRANILHIAVDTESVEGCVYVKCATTDDALKVFRVRL